MFPFFIKFVKRNYLIDQRTS